MTVRYIFSVSTGRAGSNYLCELFRHVEGCVAEHEPEPKLHADPMRAFLAGDAAPLEARMADKVASIERIRGDARVYVETNHTFIKGFGWLLPGRIPEDEIGVVVLHRDPAKIRASMHRVLCTPFLPAGDQWMITPLAKPHHVPLPREFSFPMLRFHAYRLASRTFARPGVVRRLTRGKRTVLPAIQRYEEALIDWYIAETAARWTAYKARFPRVTSFECDVESLNTAEGVAAMLAPFGLVAKPSIAGVLGQPTNTKPEKRVVAR